MRFREIRGGLLLPVSTEEQDLVKFIESSADGVVEHQQLDERQGELARKLVSRGVLDRSDLGGTFYMVSKLDDIWR